MIGRLAPTIASALVIALSLMIHAQESTRAVKVFAAGSLTAPLTAVAAALERTQRIRIEFTFGPSGTLRERLEDGEAADLFASANMEHPQALHDAGRSGPVQLFTRNTLCAFTRPDVNVTADTLLARMVDPAVKLGTSTPVSDPAGDYTWMMFRKADALRLGAYDTLSTKAQQLFGRCGDGGRVHRVSRRTAHLCRRGLCVDRRSVERMCAR